MRVISSFLAAALAAAAPAAAQDASRTYPSERLEIGVDREALINTSWAAVPQHLEWDVALLFAYSNDPMFTYTVSPGGVPTDRADSIVENRLGAHLTGSIGLFDWLQVGAELPVLLFQARDAQRAPAGDAEALGTFGAGDLRLYPKASILRQRNGAPLDIGVQIPVTLPTGASTDFYGNTGFSFTPTLLASREFDVGFGVIRLAGNLGTRLRTEEAIVDAQNTLSHELIGRVGAGYVFLVAEDRPTEVSLSFANAAQISGFINAIPVRSPSEVLGEVDHTIAGPFSAFIGGAVGVMAGAGGPDYRVYGGARFAPRTAPDRDGDGIPDRKDTCVKEPETKNGFQDEDGCPDVDDADKDGIRDSDDKCVDVAEDKDGFEDEDGCPDLDHDKDGLNNDADKCPDQAEDKDGFEDADGCPDLDNDGDGVADTADKCADVAEDKDGFEDTDGCVDADNDNDGVLDAADKCPVEAGVKENRGCPDADRDGDTVVDRLDNCPDEKGSAANAGCAARQLVVIKAEKLEILDKVFFKTGKDIIEKKSFALLDNVAAVLKSHPEIAKVRVEGHTDNVGVPAKNKDLSDRRAKAVVAYLASKGVDAARLVGEGFGDEKPIGDNATDEGKANNRRVEFAIVQ
jgi:outer membrane protein OmpA-like peptidoglycan-associated protein